MNYKALPKIELHLHLDCSLSYDVVKKIKPGVTPQEYASNYVAPSKCTNLVEYLARAGASISIMQTKEELELVTLDLFDQLKADGVIYAEIRYAPLLHVRKGLTPTEVVDIVEKAVQKGIQQTGVQANIILATLRHYSEEESMQTIKLVEAFKGTHVVGFDIAADEAGYPIDNHIKAFQYAKDKGIPSTAHAGEACGAESVWEVLSNMYPQRIGHGIRSIEDDKLIKHLKEHHIHLEICPTSNVVVNVFDTIHEHTIDDLYKRGVSLGINTDGRGLCNIDLTHEYELLHTVFGWTENEFLACNLHAVDACFATAELKASLKQQILDGFRGK